MTSRRGKGSSRFALALAAVPLAAVIFVGAACAPHGTPGAGGQGSSGGGGAPAPEAYAQERPRLLRALGSFRFSPAPGAAARAARVSLVRVKESREGAFTILGPGCGPRLAGVTGPGHGRLPAGRF